MYINTQMRYHLHFSTEELRNMSDEEWANHFAMLQNIRKEEAKQKPFGH